MLVNKTKGFTLLELVIGIVVFAIALGLFTSMIVPQAVRSVDPIFQVRAAELSKSLINEISSKSFDEISDRTGGLFRCNDSGQDDCTTSDNLGDDDESRVNYDDVDDYNGLVVADENIKNALDEAITLDGAPLYTGFSVAVVVVYDDNMDGIDDAISQSDATYIGNTKLITVTVTTPNSEEIRFSAFRSNF
jgi:MSHA pilin protein MshD